MTPRTDERTSPEGLGRGRKIPSSARRAGLAVSGACSPYTGRKPSYRMYVDVRPPALREGVPGVARQTGRYGPALVHPPVR
jgi:hypothetical protein